jgi:hypothetical protein
VQSGAGVIKRRSARSRRVECVHNGCVHAGLWTIFRWLPDSLPLVTIMEDEHGLNG